MTKFRTDICGDERCLKHAKIELSHDEVEFCLNQVNRQVRGRSDGGGTVVSEYLSDLLREALSRKIRDARTMMVS